MSEDSFSRLLPAVCAGLGLFLVGVANLALVRRGRRLRAAATLAAVGVAVGAASAFDMAGATARLLALGLAPCLLLGSRRLVSGVAALAAAANRPVVRYALLGAAG